MFSRILATAAVLLVAAGFVAAETYRGIITAASKDEVTILVRKDKTDKKGTEKKFKVGKDAKFVKIAKKDKSESSPEDLTKAIEGSKGKVKGVPGTVTTEGEGDKEVATEIGFGGGKKGK